MAPDWLFYWMTQPSGLLVIGLATIVVPFLLWWLLLGEDFRRFGFAPLSVAYVCATLGLVLLTFAISYADFSNSVSGGLVQEAQRWSTVPGRTVYVAVLSLIIVVPLVVIVGVPLAALLLRKRKLTYLNIALAALSLWLALTLLNWVVPLNEWHRTHRLESFTTILMEFLPGVVLIGVPFMLGVRAVSAGRPN